MKNCLTFVFLSTTDWDAAQFGSRQQVAMELARRGHRLLFVEVPRALHSFISDPTGTRKALRRMGKMRWIDETLAVYTPKPVLPVYYHPVSNWVNQRLLVRDVQHALKQVGRQALVPVAAEESQRAGDSRAGNTHLHGPRDESAPAGLRRFHRIGEVRRQQQVAQARFRVVGILDLPQED